MINLFIFSDVNQLLNQVKQKSLIKDENQGITRN
jgi:hypothetical protein